MPGNYNNPFMYGQCHDGNLLAFHHDDGKRFPFLSNSPLTFYIKIDPSSR
jgi:hypothetical protein